MLQLARLSDELPTGFAALRCEADADGYRHMARLAQDWESGAERFDRPGEALLAAFLDGELAGIGGMTQEPLPAPEPALRIRRFYVKQGARRQGLGRTLANALLQEALDQVALVTVHAARPPAPAFWEALGFSPTPDHGWSHELRRPGMAGRR
ncbi:GNAT family N-acetyltransferase [Phenylobacterium hankyongense]|uniref:GNAT family N-acetyltransferase n=1 Tax=Phenylobacterium hankyongense TaxID=1813876 RepID=A0A328B3P8_9CAUL|nr:GNAT family N-acetyltransferase [Phenylobacterium hankyongense]RAK60464.1 GNAT family N-acetyltransferase [Phenylobacterium hankyongense]